MAREKPSPKTVVAFKVDPAMADLLDKLPNKSEFIRKAIAAQLGVHCPLCTGKGVVSRGVHNHYAPVIQQARARACASCGELQPFALDAADIPADDRDRLEQFYLGGPLYCEKCYETAPSCHDCGWHITPDLAAEHHKQAHCTHE